MRRLKLFTALCLLIIAGLSDAIASPPSSITVQGKLTDAGGSPLPAGAKSFTFRIFDAASFGTQVWPSVGGEIQSITSSTDGLWIGLVGAVNPLTDPVFSDSVRWLEINVDGTTLPRVRLVSGPYAFRVATVDGATGGNISSSVSIGTGHIISGNQAFAAGTDHEVTGDRASVSGGRTNHATGQYSHVGGGQNNTADTVGATIGGGQGNAATQSNAVVAGGSSNTASGDRGAIIGGVGNVASGAFSTLGGGFDNEASGSISFVGGGNHTYARGEAAFVGGGGGSGAFIGTDADSNSASGDRSAIVGGFGQLASGQASLVGGGGYGRARGDYSVLVGGGGASFSDSNQALGTLSFLGGGHRNLAIGDSSIVVGGTRNTANGRGAVVVGGSENHARGAFSFIGGGGGMFADSNAALGQFSVAVGGNHAIATGDFSFVGGGYNNRAQSDYSFTGGGRSNSIPTGINSVVVGGSGNSVTASNSAIVGGDSNSVIGPSAFIGGGRANGIISGFASILGGLHNYVTGSRAAALGGFADTTGGNFSVTLGGYLNRTGLSGHYSLAAGKRAKADHTGTFVWADSTEADFASTATNQFLIRASGGVGIGTASPLAQLHVMESTTGSVVVNVSSSAVFERSSSNYISIVGGYKSNRGILFADSSTTLSGAILYGSTVENGLDFRTNGTVRMVIDSLGNVGIGDNSPELKLDVVGNVGVTGTICATGAITGNSVGCLSDARFKCDIATLPNALATVEKLRGVHYNWKTDEFPDHDFPKGEQIGLIAQEVRSVVPQAVVPMTDGYLAVDYARLVPLLIEGIKEQQQQIATQQKRIDEQEARIREIESQRPR